MRSVLVKRKVSVAVLSVAGLLLITVVPAYGQESSPVSGRVINGTIEGIAVAGVPVSLRRVVDGEEAEFLTVTTDSEGLFAFEEGPESDDGYILVTTYQGIDYSVAVSLGDDLRDVILTIYELTASLEEVRISMNSVLVVDIDSEAQTLSVMELVLVENTGDRIFITDINEGRSMNLLRFPLPPNVVNLSVQTELPEGEVIQVDTGFAITSAVPPGEYSMAFTYTAPYEEGIIDFSRQFLQGVESFRFLVPEGIGSVTDSSLESMESTQIGETAFQVLSAENIARGDSVTIALGDLTGRSVSRRILDQMSSPIWGTVVTVVLIAALGGLVVLGVSRARRWKAPSISGEVWDDHGALVKAIASLDNRHEMGEVEDGEYRELRQTLKARLMELAQEERSIR